MMVGTHTERASFGGELRRRGFWDEPYWMGVPLASTIEKASDIWAMGSWPRTERERLKGPIRGQKGRPKSCRGAGTGSLTCGDSLQLLPIVLFRVR
eukprot:scaffold138248_cov99-Phaeocystis_antarctica.AAC.1